MRTESSQGLCKRATAALLAASILSLARPVPAAKEPAKAAPPAASKPSAEADNPNFPPQLVAVNPAPGSEDVDPALAEISVTFNRDMGGGMSWTGGGEIFPPIPQGQKPHWKGARTCVLPVKLEAGKYYRVGINSTGFLNFRSDKGVPADPTVIYFTTKGADAETKKKLERPAIAKLSPANGAEGVPASTTELRVEFSVPMGSGMSWTGGGELYPEIPEGAKSAWSEDGKTCALPVKLKPGWEYHLGINGKSFNNFQSAWGVPALPVHYTFKPGK